MPETMLSVKQVAQRCGVTEKTVRDWLARGHLAGSKVGPKLWRIRPADLDEFLNRAA